MNKIILSGNLTADPVKSTSANGTSVCRFTIAVSRRFSNETDFFNVTCFSKTADYVAQFLSKGKKAGVAGSIQLRKYVDKDGNNRQAVDVIADEVESLSPRTESGAQGNESVEPVGLQEDTTDAGLPF